MNIINITADAFLSSPLFPRLQQNFRIHKIFDPSKHHSLKSISRKQHIDDEKELLAKACLWM